MDIYCVSFQDEIVGTEVVVPPVPLRTERVESPELYVICALVPTLIWYALTCAGVSPEPVSETSPYGANNIASSEAVFPERIAGDDVSIELLLETRTI